MGKIGIQNAGVPNALALDNVNSEAFYSNRAWIAPGFCTLALECEAVSGT